MNLISSQGSSMHTKSAMKRTISCTSKGAWKFIFFLVESVIWDHLLERTTRGNREVKPLPAKPPNCRAAIFVFLIHQWLSVYKLAPGPLVLEKKPWIYRKIPKISPRAYIFQRPFLRGLFLEGLIFGGAFLWRELCVSKSIGLAFWVARKFTVFALFYSVFEGHFQVQAPGGLIFGGAI